MNKVVPQDAVLVPDSADCKFKGIIYDTYQWQQELFDGSKTTFEMLKRPDTVEVIGVVGDKILVLRDEQPRTGVRLSFPGGRVDKDDLDIEAAVKREVKEETGYEFKRWRLVKVWQPHTKIEWFIHTFLAWDVENVGEPHVDAGEKIEVEIVSFNEVKKIVLDKAGYLGEAQAIFENIQDIPELLKLPTYNGKEV